MARERLGGRGDGRFRSLLTLTSQAKCAYTPSTSQRKVATMGVAALNCINKA